MPYSGGVGPDAPSVGLSVSSEQEAPAAQSWSKHRHQQLFWKMMDEDLKLAQALAGIPANHLHRTNSEYQMVSASSSGGAGAASDSAAGEDSSGANIKTHASMVLEKIQGFR